MPFSNALYLYRKNRDVSRRPKWSRIGGGGGISHVVSIATLTHYCFNVAPMSATLAQP